MKKAGLALVAIAGVAVCLSGCGTSGVKDVPDTVATVNGEKISATQYLDETHRRIGQEVLRNMIEQSIIMSWAKDENVAPTADQVQKQIDTLKRDGIYQDRVKTMGEDALKSELEAAQARINLMEKMSKPSDEEIQAVYTQMKSRYVHGPRKYVAVVIGPKKDKLEKARKAAKDGTDIDQVSSMYSDSPYATQGAIKVWVEDNQQGMPPAVLDAAKNAKVGDVSKVFTLGQSGQMTQYGILKVLDTQPKANVPLKDVKDEVAGMLALQKSQTDLDFQKKLNAKKKAAKIDVNIEEYKNLVFTFKNPPEPSPMMGQMQPGPAPAAKPAK